MDLIAAAAQLLFLDVPDHAAVDLAVRAARLDAAPRLRLARQRGAAQPRARKGRDSRRPDPLDDDTPHWLAQRWRATYGEATARRIARAHRDEPTLDLSVKSDAEGWARRLGGVVLPTGSVRLGSRAAIAELEGYRRRGLVGAGAAAALPAKLLGVGGGHGSSIFAPPRAARRRICS